MDHKTLLYTKNHEWIQPEGDVLAVGITDHAQHQLGDIVFVDAPEVGRTLSAGDDFVVVESPKAAADVYAPVSGEIVEVNEDLSAEPGKVNQEPYGGGWLVKIKPSNPEELKELLSWDDYLKLVEG